MNKPKVIAICGACGFDIAGNSTGEGILPGQICGMCESTYEALDKIDTLTARVEELEHPRHRDVTIPVLHKENSRLIARVEDLEAERLTLYIGAGELTLENNQLKAKVEELEAHPGEPKASLMAELKYINDENERLEVEANKANELRLAINDLAAENTRLEDMLKESGRVNLDLQAEQTNKSIYEIQFLTGATVWVNGETLSVSSGDTLRVVTIERVRPPNLKDLRSWWRRFVMRLRAPDWE